MSHYETVTRCRICGETSLTPVFSLGEQAITGVFPKSRAEYVPIVPVELVVCQACGLTQLGHSYNLSEIYTDSYGYRSGLNASMVAHLERKVRKLFHYHPLNRWDVVVDIGSNDGTLLGFYGDDIQRIGIDPLAGKFRSHYKPGIEVVEGFFSVGEYSRQFGELKASIVTSIAMFYDLPDPVQFARDVAAILDEDGIWHLEMSYQPTMLHLNAMDTVCQEHLEYYRLRDIHNIAQRVGLAIVDIEQNAVNGGSLAVTLMHEKHQERAYRSLIDWMLGRETMDLDDFRVFGMHAANMREQLRSLVIRARQDGKTVAALGASTKGNVLLQYCGFGPEDIQFVMDVNPEKFGRFTPGTLIPIVSEEEGRAQNPDLLMVPIWHFRDGVIRREQEFLNNGGKLIFPMPYVEVVG